MCDIIFLLSEQGSTLCNYDEVTANGAVNLFKSCVRNVSV